MAMFSFSDFHGIITAQCTTETVIRYNHVRQAQVQTESESRSESSTRVLHQCIWPWSHAEGLRLAAAVKLPPLLICRRATMQSHGERWKTEGGVEEGGRARIRKMDLDAGEG